MPLISQARFVGSNPTPAEFRQQALGRSQELAGLVGTLPGEFQRHHGVEAQVDAPLTQADWEINSIAGTGEVNPHHFSLALNFSRAVAVDGVGNVFFADIWNNRFR